ncbi:MAG: calcium/proton exchanger [Lachnospiraceae bacterium]|nr:calcium/proton exchanger [Lachnospiraceae bacterium]
MKVLYVLLAFIPISVLAHFAGWGGMWVFLFSSLSIIALAGIMGKATESAAHYLGGRVGGFLNATFGNATELLINIFAIKAGLYDVVKASIAGAVIGNILLVLGLSMLCGGLKYKVQKFDIKSVEMNSSMLLFAVIGLCVPAIFVHTLPETSAKTAELSLVVAIFMFALYIAQMVFSFVTHKDYFEHANEEEEAPDWSLKKSLIILVIVTIFIGIESELFTGSVEAMTQAVGLSAGFVGIVLIPIIGNAAEHSTAVLMAMKNKLNVSVEVSVGSSLQIILFVAPVLLFISYIWKPMSLMFTPFELVAMVFSVIIANRVVEDGQSNWLEGAQLVAIYVILAAAFLIV